MVDIRGISLILGGSKVPLDIILSDIKKNRNARVVYGRRALNAQLPGFLHSPTTDWDVYTSKPKKVANRIKGKLNREVANSKPSVARGSYFVVKPALHPQTWRIKEVGKDGLRGTKDDVVVADYSRRPKELKTVKINGVLYESWMSIKKGKKMSLANPSNKFRHYKDQTDLDKMQMSKKMWGVPQRRKK